MDKKINDYTKTVWLNIASYHIGLRYPTVSLEVNPAFNLNAKGNIRLKTFVSNKKGTLLTLVEHVYNSSREEDIWTALEHVRRKFNSDCEKVKDNFIFNSDTAIYEPFETNKK